MTRKILALVVALALLISAAGAALATDKYAPVEGKTYAFDILSAQANPVENDAPLVQYWNKKFGVEINIVNAAGEALNVLIAAGDAPDTLSISGVPNYTKLARDGVLLEMDEEVIKTYAPNYHVKMIEYAPDYFENCKVDGAIYGLNGINYWAAFHQPIAWNGQWLEAIGMDHAPATFDEMDAALRGFALNDPDGNGQKDTFGLSQSGMQLVYSAFGAIVPESGIFWQEMNGELYPTLITENAKNALAYLAELYKAEVLSPDFITGENTGGYWANSHAFINGQVGLSCMANHYHWAPGDETRDYASGGSNWAAIYETNPEAALAIKYGQPIPTADGWQYFASQGTTYSNSFSCLNSDLESEPDKIGKLLQMYDYIGSTDVENLATAIYGFKGEHWDYATARGQEMPARDPARTAVDDILLGGNTTMFFLVAPQVYSAAYPEHFITAKLMEVDKYVIQTAVTSSLDAQNMYGDDCNTLKQEFYTAVIRGEKSVEEFDAFVAEWLAMGGQEIWDEAKAAYQK